MPAPETRVAYGRAKRTVEYAVEVQFQPGGKWCAGKSHYRATHDGAKLLRAELLTERMYTATRIVEVVVIRRTITEEVVP